MMKKITLLIFLVITSATFSQHWTTQTVVLDSDYSVKFDVNTTTNIVTMTMIGPSDRWLGIGINTDNSYNPSAPPFGMSQFAGDDVITYNSSTIVDREMGAGNFGPPSDSVQSWTVISDDVASTTRTIVATRDRDTGDANDYTFPTTPPIALTIVWAKGGNGTNNSNISFHTGGRGAILANNNILSNENFQVNPARFTISPNPGKRDLNIGILHDVSRDYNLEVYDVLGKQIYRGQLTSDETSIDVTNWRRGVYLVKLSSDQSTQTKRFIKQ